MSNKRNKNSRARQVRTRSKDAGPRVDRTPMARPISTASRDLDRQLEAGYVEPETAKDVPTGGGAFGAIRSGMARKDQGPDGSALHKRRTLGEWGLWFGGAGLVGWIAFKLIGS